MANRINDLAEAMKKHEGFYPGSASFRNRNPGNFRCSPLVMGELGAVRCVNNLAVFPTYEKGFAALKQFLIYACTDKLRSYKSAMTLLEFYERYAPSSDHNNPNNYASAVAKDLGVSIGTKIKDLYEAEPTTPKTEVQGIDQFFYWQRHPRYKNVKLGNSNLSFQNKGCFPCCLAYMVKRDPLEVM